MWIYLNNAFLSIVAEAGSKTRLLVRSRFPGDIEQVFPDAVVEHTPTFDYPYRTVLPKGLVGDILARQVAGISYTNFKSSIADNGRRRRYTDVYHATRQRSYAYDGPSQLSLLGDVEPVADWMATADEEEIGQFLLDVDNAVDATGDEQDAIPPWMVS